MSVNKWIRTAHHRYGIDDDDFSTQYDIDLIKDEIDKLKKDMYEEMYEDMSGSVSTKTRHDFEHIAKVLMEALSQQGKEDFVLIQDNKVRSWWAEEKEVQRIAQVHAEAKRKLAELFTDEERKLLGIDKK